MGQNFKTEELQTFLEKELSLPLRPLIRLSGHAHSFNFRAEAADGSCRFAVKCLIRQKRREEMLARLLAHTQEKRCPLVPTILFDRRCFSFRDCIVLCFSWIPGGGKYFDRLTDAERKNFLASYAEFLHALRDDGFILPPWEFGETRGRLWERVRELRCRPLLREIEQIPSASLRHTPERMRIIHGDLHYGNFFFDGDRVSGFLDMEEWRFGYPAEDLIRYVIVSAEHLHWFSWKRRRYLLQAFSALVRETDYPEDEWMLAIDGYLIRKLAKKIPLTRLSPFLRINLPWRIRFYRALRERVRQALKTRQERKTK